MTAYSPSPPRAFWPAFDSIPSGRALMIVWQSSFGNDFFKIQPFLQPTPTHSLLYPCTRIPPCQCDHDVREDPSGNSSASAPVATAIPSRSLAATP